MKAIDVFTMCIRNLFKRKLRTFLTLLGVMIGTGSIIVMISLGLAIDEQFAQMIEDRNIDMTMVRVWPQWGGFSMGPDGSMQERVPRELTDDSVEAILRIPGVAVASPIIQTNLHLRSGPYVSSARVTGLRPEALAMMGHDLQWGRFLESGDEFGALFSAHSEREFFDSTDRSATWSERTWDQSDDVPTLVDVRNDDIRLYYDDSQFWATRQFGGGGMRFFGGGGGGMVFFEGGFGGGGIFDDDDEWGVDLEEALRPVRSFELNVVGEIVAQPRGGDGWQPIETTIYMDIDTLLHLEHLRTEAQRREQEEREFNPHFSGILGAPRQTYNELLVRSECMDSTSEVALAIRQMGYHADYDAHWIEDMRQQTRGIETLLAAIAAVSLLVAAINIANTMITSVTERTREIGVMKVIGASVADVRKLFLLESVVIGLLGGLFGTALALGMSYVMNNFDIAFLENLNMGLPSWATVGDERAVVSLVTPWLCGLALAVAAGVGLVSGYYPAWRATRLSALAAIRGD